MTDTTGTLFLPQAASTTARDVDPLFNFLVWMSAFFFALIVTLVVIFIIKYRRKKGERHPNAPEHNAWLEATWIIIPTILVLVIFVWGMRGYLRLNIVPANAMEVKVTAQRWFWSFDYPDGATLVNELVAPVDKPVKLLMSSRDVIHSFYVPAFRIKRDVLPNRYSIAWFQATHTGDFPLLCAEYCGEKHSAMLGMVKVMGEREYQEWLEQAASVGEGMSPAEYGALLYRSKACYTCHSIDGAPGNGPSFLNIFGHEVQFKDGSKLTIDENYIRESVLNPQAKTVAGYQPIMPTYQGLLKERELDGLVAFIKSLSP